MKDAAIEVVWKSLDKFHIELPSWGFANTGALASESSFQPAAATTSKKRNSATPRRFTLPDAELPDPRHFTFSGFAEWLEGCF
jgi:hypothetical protein